MFPEPPTRWAQGLVREVIQTGTPGTRGSCPAPTPPREGTSRAAPGWRRAAWRRWWRCRWSRRRARLRRAARRRGRLPAPARARRRGRGGAGARGAPAGAGADELACPAAAARRRRRGVGPGGAAAAAAGAAGAAAAGAAADGRVADALLGGTRVLLQRHHGETLGRKTDVLSNLQRYGVIARGDGYYDRIVGTYARKAYVVSHSALPFKDL